MANTKENHEKIEDTKGKPWGQGQAARARQPPAPNTHQKSTRRTPEVEPRRRRTPAFQNFTLWCPAITYNRLFNDECEYSEWLIDAIFDAGWGGG